MHDVKSGIVVLGAMLAVALLRQVTAKVPKFLLPWVTAVIAMLVQIVMLKGDVNAEQVLDAAILGLAASGLWSGGGKYVASKTGLAPPSDRPNAA